jgi:uncharacterized protein (TIGR02246 family)
MEDYDVARREIDRLLNALVSAWNQHDARAYAVNFADDVDFTNVFGIRMHGRSSIERSHAVIFKEMFKDSCLAISDTHVRFIRPDVAAIAARWEMTGARDPQGKEWPKRHGLMNMVATESPSGWLPLVFHNQDLPPPERVSEVAELLRST